MDKWRFLGAGVVVGALLLCAAACTPGGEPVVTESPSGGSSPVATTPVASPSPTPTGTAALLAQLPYGATSPGLDGAIVTAEFFVELYGTMLQTGDTALWDALSGPECAFCEDASATAKNFATEGTVISGGLTTADPALIRANARDDGFVYVGVVVEQAPLEMTAADGTSESVDGETSGVVFQMSQVGDTWRILGGQVVEPGDIK